jgi:hypothetical protein
MKKRNGFVSNSSSSSFIVAFPKDIKSREEFKEILLGDSDEKYLIDSYYSNNYSSEDAINVLYNDYCQGKNLTEFEIKETIEDLFYWDCNGDIDCIKKETEIKYNEFMKDNHDADIKKFRYSDNDGEGYLEHSNVFYNLPHIEINNH